MSLVLFTEAFVYINIICIGGRGAKYRPDQALICIARDAKCQSDQALIAHSIFLRIITGKKMEVGLEKQPCLGYCMSRK